MLFDYPYSFLNLGKDPIPCIEKSLITPLKYPDQNGAGFTDSTLTHELTLQTRTDPQASLYESYAFTNGTHPHH